MIPYAALYCSLRIGVCCCRSVYSHQAHPSITIDVTHTFIIHTQFLSVINIPAILINHQKPPKATKTFVLVGFQLNDSAIATRSEQNVCPRGFQLNDSTHSHHKQQVICPQQVPAIGFSQIHQQQQKQLSPPGSSYHLDDLRALKHYMKNPDCKRHEPVRTNRGSAKTSP